MLRLSSYLIHQTFLSTPHSLYYFFFIMRKSKYDVVIVLICTCFLYYYIFIFQFPLIDCADYGIIGDRPCHLIHGGIIWSSLFAVMFAFLYIYADKLEPFNRNYVKRYFLMGVRDFKVKMAEGIEWHRNYFFFRKELRREWIFFRTKKKRFFRSWRRIK
jgi:hypothetical protein